MKVSIYLSLAALRLFRAGVPVVAYTFKDEDTTVEVKVNIYDFVVIKKYSSVRGWIIKREPWIKRVLARIFRRRYAEYKDKRRDKTSS